MHMVKVVVWVLNHMASVALHRGVQISLDLKKKHGPDRELKDFKEHLDTHLPPNYDKLKRATLCTLPSHSPILALRKLP